jgi:hypothetical protein
LEKEILFSLMAEKGHSKRYMISQKWFRKWEGVMDSHNPIVESNIKNLSLNFMNE